MIKFYVANQMKDKKKCSFCGRDESEVGFLLTGLNGNICDECAERAYEYVQQIEQQNEGAKIQNIDLKEIPKPKEIKDYLDQYVGRSGTIRMSGSNCVDAVSGATATSKAITAGVNRALAIVANLDPEDDQPYEDGEV